MSMFTNLFPDTKSLGENVQAEKTTTDATATVALSIPVPEGEAVKITVNVTARQSTGAKRAMWTLSGLFYRNTSGNVTAEGDTLTVDSHMPDGCAYAAVLEANTTTQTIDVKITGTAAETVYWLTQANYFRR